MSSRRSAGRAPTIIVAATALVLGLLVAPPAQAAFPGDDGRVAFTRANQIHTIKANGRGLTRLTSAGKNYRPKWSPDGRRIAYVNEVDGKRDLWVMRPNGRRKQQVTRLGDVRFFSWSPDGRSFALGHAGTLHRMRARAPFGAPTQILAELDWGWDVDELGPLWAYRDVSWSPDGDHIALLSQQCMHQCLNVVNWRERKAWMHFEWGGEQNGPGFYEGLDWSPDGTRIATSGKEWYWDEDEPPQRIQVSRFPGRQGESFASAAGDKQLAFAPSGRSTVLMNGTSGVARLYVTSADGSARRFLTKGYLPDWQPRP